MRVVVYGTLKKGYHNNRLLRSSTFVSECIVQGYKLYDSGFPVAKSDMDSNLRGEIWEIGDDKSVLGALDSLEGYREATPENSMYLRRPVVALSLNEGTETRIDAQMYVGNPTFWDQFRGMRECGQDVNGTYYWQRNTHW